MDGLGEERVSPELAEDYHTMTPTETLVVLHVRRERRLGALWQQDHPSSPGLNWSHEARGPWGPIFPHPLPQAQSILHAKVLEVRFFQVVGNRSE